jgi:superfamily II DNA or RNA helicase
LDSYVQEPTRLYLPDGVENSPGFIELQKALRYEDKRITYQYLKWKGIQKQDDRWLESGGEGYRNWYVSKFGREDLDSKVKQFNEERFKLCLLFENGRYCVYSGLRKLVEEKLAVTLPKQQFASPNEWKNIPWAVEPPKPRWYQEKATDLLCPLDGSRTHGGIEVGTGLGKSLIIALIAKRIGLPAIVVVPTLSIGSQMVEDFSRWFGKGRVGQFFDGKKQSDKHIVIAVSKSLMNVEEGSKDWANISTRKAVFADECHLTPPESLSTVMFNLLSQVPYRYFFSGTCFRNDGLQLLLQGITGDIVFEMSVKQGIEEGFLSPLKFFQWRITSDSKINCEDAIKMNNIHFHQNAKVYKHAAYLINRAVTEKKRRVLVLVDTVDQFARLLDGGLAVEARFAHGGVTPKNRDTVPIAYWKSDTRELVKAFDRGEYPVLVGTSCIGVGTDVKSADFVISLVGLTSEIEISQGIGRGTRLFSGKKDCMYHDYWITNIDKLSRHADKRRVIFDSIYGQCKILEAK